MEDMIEKAVALLLMAGISSLPYEVRIDSDAATYAWCDLAYAVFGPDHWSHVVYDADFGGEETLFNHFRAYN